MKKRAIATCVGLLLAVLLIGAGCGGSGGTRTFRVPSSAMEPTIHCGRGSGIRYGCLGTQDDRVVVKKVPSLKRGDIIVFRTPPKAAVQCGEGGIFVKRVVGLPGETVSYNGRTLLINGVVTPERYMPPARQGGTTGMWRVPKGSYFVMGDSRAMSCDSRRWGGVPKRNVIGKVVAIERSGKRIDLP